ncbi:MAG: hypothetical protein TEF_16235 [Rhizobiales bacterium NRL2]|jgi:hypothetical protein|nr:MAG: hypothetical protein TEF_16235 [Rhizobiales bacterium NRL2]
MKRIVAEHLGLWLIAGVMFAGLGVASACDDTVGTASAKERVMTPRAAQTMVQDPTGQFIGYRPAMAVGAM